MRIKIEIRPAYMRLNARKDLNIIYHLFILCPLWTTEHATVLFWKYTMAVFVTCFFFPLPLQRPRDDG